MERRRFLAAMGLGGTVVLVATTVALAREIPVVGILNQSPGPQSRSVDTLREYFRKIGYVEGRTIALEVRFAGGSSERFSALAAELVGRKVDLLVAIGPAALKAARAATTSIPIIALDLESDPVEGGYARSIAHPGGNITGVFLDLPGLTGKWLELITQAAHGVRRAGIVRDVSTGPWQLAAVRAAAQRIGIDLQILEVQKPADVERALEASAKRRSQVLVELSSPLLNQKALEVRVASFAIKRRMPTISMFRSFAENGGLLAYGPYEPEYLRSLAVTVDKVLKGTAPADIPIEQPKKFELVVNLKTAKALGLTIPPAVLLRADQVID